MSTVTELKLSEISPAPDNPRRDLGDLAELAASMGELGLLQPLVVTPRNGNYMVVCGHRRLAAAKKAKLATVPVVVRELDEPQRIKAMLVENCQRTDLATIEEARAYAQLVALGLSQRAIATAVGKGQSHVSKRLQLLELPESVIAAVDSGGITIGDALELVSLKDHPKHLKRVIDRPAWQTIAYAVEQAKREIERTKRVDAAVAKLRAKGITPVKLGAYGEAKPPMQKIGPGWGQLDVDAKAHEKLECHAVGVDPRSGDLVPVCTKPENHAAEIPSASVPAARKMTAAEKAAEREHEELKAAAERRLEFIGTIANGKIAKDDLFEISLYALFSAHYWEPFEWACRMLNVPIESAIVESREADTVEDAETALADPYKDLEAEDGEKALAAYAAVSPANRLRASLALSMCIVEDRDCRARWQPWGAGARALFNILERHGYQSSPIEKTKLAEAARS